MKKTISLFLALALLAGICPAFASNALNASAFHSSYAAATDATAVYGKASYLYDTLTLAGDGFEAKMDYTLMDIEALARDGGLGFESGYSLVNSGGALTVQTFTGARLYDLLVYSGLDESLPDKTPVKAISKDGYSIALTLGALRSEGYGRYVNSTGEAEEKGLPILVAFGVDGVPLVGPTGTEPVTKKFTEADGFVESAQNVGGSMRLIVGQTTAGEFNALSCAKWLAAVVVGDPDGYVYERETTTPSDQQQEPESGGNWKHQQDSYLDVELSISGTEAQAVGISLRELEEMDDIIVRQYFAASAGRDAYEGVVLRELIDYCLADGVERPSKVTVVASDGYSSEIDLDALYNGIDSNYQPGAHRDIILAYAINGAPLVESADDAGYNGYNAFGPLRLVVENTISAWVKNVVEIVIGEPVSDKEVVPLPFDDLEGYDWALEAIGVLSERGIVNGTSASTYSPANNLKRGDFILMLYRAAASFNADSAFPQLPVLTDPFSDVPKDSYYAQALLAAKMAGVALGDGGFFRPEDSITRQDAMVLLYRTLSLAGADLSKRDDLSAFSDAASVAGYASQAVQALVAAGIVGGSDGKLSPENNISRAEMAVLLYRATLLF